MQIYRKEFNRLNRVRSTVKSRFPHLRINKKQEIIRLLYEISKKQGVSPETIVCDIASRDFNKIKHHLLRRRFPYAYLNNAISRPYLPQIKLDPRSILNLQATSASPHNYGQGTRFYPKRIIIEKAAQGSHLADRFRKSFPRSTFSEIKSLKGYLKKKRKPSIKNYNNRSETVFITYEYHDFFKKCPCTKKAVSCGYHIFNLSFGCIFECTFCYLQEYTNSPGLIFSANINRFFESFNSYKRPRMRIGTGEFSDSLMLDHITGYSVPIVEFFKKHEGLTFEFKTKSSNIDNLLKTKHAGNIVVAWSLNPQTIIDENEFFSPSLDKRISSARRCVEAGYKVAFHFDPVVYFRGWRKEYEKLTGLLFASIKPKSIAWISIGTLRFNPKVKGIIEQRFPGNKILDEELVLGFDNKLRYPSGIRQEIYRAMLEMLFKHSKRLPIYLCMEEASIWRDLRKYLSLQI